MDPEELDSEPKLLAAAATILDNLHFTSDMPRETKWRTTQQLANELKMSSEGAISQLNKILLDHETRSLDRLAKSLPPEAKIRRAYYPDRTTTQPLWGSVKQHGPPWPGLRPDRSDRPGTVPSNLVVPYGAPHVFLSHTHEDANLAMRLAEALAQMGIGSWMFETHIEQRAHIAQCVREAFTEVVGVVVLVTRTSIASLWVLTEMQTCLNVGGPIVLVVDAADTLLIRLLKSVWFPHPNEAFDLSVEYDRGVADQLNRDYALRQQSDTRTQRYGDQVHDFLATLPSYLGSIPPGTTKRIWRSILSFPDTPAEWHINVGHLQELQNRFGLI